MVFENGVKNIQAAAYNGARTVYDIWPIFDESWKKKEEEERKKIEKYLLLLMRAKNTE